MVFTARMSGRGRRCAVVLWFDLCLFHACQPTLNAQEACARRLRPRRLGPKSNRVLGRAPLEPSLTFHSSRTSRRKRRGRNNRSSRVSPVASTPPTRRESTGKLLRRSTEQVVQQNGPGDADVERVHARIIRGRADLDQRVARAPHGRPQALALTANHQDRRLCRIQT